MTTNADKRATRLARTPAERKALRVTRQKRRQEKAEAIREENKDSYAPTYEINNEFPDTFNPW